MAAPEILKYNGIAADNCHIIGPVVASFAIIALSGCTRTVATYNAPLGLWLMVSPWLMNYENGASMINSFSSGILITFFSFFKRKTIQQYGGGWSAVWKSVSRD